ncbi:hypothetical protein V5O48_010135 [Marasmius crinis-equi]|uniref:Uncharacterized protein n=1 Tax=Marasmius crinis-equi TaxID=585013 RepID=A0ABR3F9N0_9AGAR
MPPNHLSTPNDGQRQILRYLSNTQKAPPKRHAGLDALPEPKEEKEQGKKSSKKEWKVRLEMYIVPVKSGPVQPAFMSPLFLLHHHKDWWSPPILRSTPHHNDPRGALNATIEREMASRLNEFDWQMSGWLSAN